MPDTPLSRNGGSPAKACTCLGLIRAASAALCAVCGLSCSELPVLEPKVCGNGFVEPEAGEECDTFVEEGHRCRGAGVPNPCRFECSVDPNVTEPHCPEGAGCGIDGVCRSPNTPLDSPGEYRAWGSEFAVPSAGLKLVDLDGDGRKDLLALGNHDSQEQALPRILFLDENGSPRDVFEPLIPIASPFIANGGGTERTGAPASKRAQRIVFTTDMGIGTFVAAPNRTVLARPYPNQRLPNDVSYRLARIHGSNASRLHEAIVLLLHTPMGDVVSPEGTESLSQLLPKPLEALLGEPVAANLNDAVDSPCDEILLTFRNDGAVYLIDICDATGMWRMPEDPLRPIVTLPGEHTMSREVVAADVDNDTHLDIVMADEEGKSYIAFGRGDGTFAGNLEDKTDLGASVGAAWPLVLRTGLCPPGGVPFAAGFPLAIGDLNGDNKADWVSAHGISLVQNVAANRTDSSVVIEVCPSNAPFGREWSVARIADLTCDARVDVVAGSSSGPDLDLFEGTGRDLLNRLAIATDGPTTQMVLGDFDGNQFQDVAFAEKAINLDKSRPSDEKVAIAFASESWRANAASAIEVGQFQFVQQLVAGNYAAEDAIDELGVLSGRDVRQDLTIFIGSSAKRLIAPLGLAHIAPTGPSRGGAPLSAVVGQFGPSPYPAVVSIALDECAATPCPYRVWFIPGLDAVGGLDAPLPSGAIPAELGFELGRVPERSFRLMKGDVQGPRDGDRLDEVLMLVQGRSGLELWQIDLRPFDADWSEQNPTRWLSSGPGMVLATLTPELIDLDGDEWPDLVMTIARPNGTPGSDLAVVWNANGSYAFDSPTLLDLGESVRGFHVSKALGVTRVVAVTAERTIEVRGRDRTLRQQTIGALPGGDAVAVGDVDGDGLQDIVIAKSGRVQVFSEVAKDP